MAVRCYQCGHLVAEHEFIRRNIYQAVSRKRFRTMRVNFCPSCNLEYEKNRKNYIRFLLWMPIWLPLLIALIVALIAVIPFIIAIGPFIVGGIFGLCVLWGIIQGVVIAYKNKHYKGL